MRNELLPENLAKFQERFGTLGDGGVHHVKFDLFSSQIHINPYTITIVIGAQDWEQEAKNQWVNLTLEIVDVTRLCLGKDTDYDFSVILCSNIAFFDGEIYVDIFSSLDKPTSPADFEGRSRKKQLLIVGKRCFWEVSPYQEREVRKW